MTATLDSQTGRRVGQSPRRGGAVIISERAVRPHPQHPCPTIATLASQIGRQAGRSQRRRGAASTREGAAQQRRAPRPGNRSLFWRLSDERGTDAQASHAWRAIFGCPCFERRAGACAIYGGATPLQCAPGTALLKTKD